VITEFKNVDNDENKTMIDNMLRKQEQYCIKAVIDRGLYYTSGPRRTKKCMSERPTKQPKDHSTK